ncbi:MAG: hypothetical protein ACREMA_09710 [Longimicrobiales bacterium]
MRIVGLSVNADGDNRRAILRAGAETLVSKGAGLDELYDAMLQALSVTSRPL